MAPRSPNSTQENNTEFNEPLSLTEDKCYIIVGDFIYPATDWQGSAAGEHIRDFLDSVQDYYLHQQVETLTRAANIFDLVLTSEQILTENVMQNFRKATFKAIGSHLSNDYNF